MNFSARGTWAAAWEVSPWLVIALTLPTLCYLTGWWRLRRRRAPADDERHLSPANRATAEHFTSIQLAYFLGAIGVIAVALMSPLDALAPLLLLVHMVQHVLLLFVAAPLIWLSAPMLPMVAGMPVGVRRWVTPLLQWPALRGLANWLCQPPVAWLVMVGTLWFWHSPGMYQLALENRTWHELEHAMFLTAALLFWWPVIQPYPSRRTSARWKLVPYLFLAGIQGTVLSGILAFSERVLYRHYADVPRLWGISPLVDQAMAGALMWVPGSIALLIPLVFVVLELITGEMNRPSSFRQAALVGHAPTVSRLPTAAPVAQGAKLEQGRWMLPVLTPEPKPAAEIRRWDLLQVPLLGRVLKSRRCRWTLRCCLLVLAGAIVVDGLLGPAMTPWNLAGVLPWTHWRGLLVLTLLVAGNFFCMTCPFLVPRTIARRWLPVGWQWPRRLRSKWLAIVLLVSFFVAYEAWSLWDSPWWTAWIIVGYFLAAAVVDGLFQGASFCKYVCPIGQFNFVQSLWSPLEVQVRDLHRCSDCRTQDCLRGNQKQHGCELNLFLPRKTGNLDCTFCMDCVDACPHGNLGIMTSRRTEQLIADRHRSGVGRIAGRPDVVVLMLVLVAAAFVNAAWMIGPVIAWESRSMAWLGMTHRAEFVIVGTLLGMLVIPAGLVVAVSWGSAKLAGLGNWTTVSLRFVPCLIPLGLGMWTAHFGFHLFTSYDTIIPAVGRFAQQWSGGPSAALPLYCGCCTATANWILPIEILLLDAGLCGSLLAGYRTAQHDCPTPRNALAAFAPWALLMLAVFVLGIWILLEPMQMRGTMLAE